MAWLGIPKQIKTDNGPNFVSASGRAFAQKWGITLIQGIPYNSTGQAIVERANQTLKSKIEVLAKTEGFSSTVPPGDQARLLATALLALNQFPRGEEANSPTQKHWATRAMDEGSLIIVRNELGEWEQGWRLVLTGRGYAVVKKDGIDPIIGRPRNSYAPIPREDDKSADIPSIPENPEQMKSGQRQHDPCRQGWRHLCVLFALQLVATTQAVPEPHPHQPFKWTLLRFERQQVIATQITPGAPSFNATLCQLVPRPRCWEYLGFYMCPSSNPRKGYCNHPNQYYCSYWGCETIAPGWIPGSGIDRYLKVQWGPYGCKPPQGWGGRGKCKYLFLNVTSPEDVGWIIGRVWGVRYTEPGTDKGGLILTKKEVVPNDPLPVGPNQILADDLAKGTMDSTTRITKIDNIAITPEMKTTRVTQIPDETLRNNSTPNETPEINPLLKMMQASYQLLNKTNPNLMEHCWLCYSITPPYYEAIGIDDAPLRVNGTNPAQCAWDTEKQGITLAHVTGSGTCIGTVPKHKKQLCANVTQSKTPAQWLVPANNAKWVCSIMGVTPCLSLDKFDESSEYCVQVTIVPKIFYHSEQCFYESQTTPEHHRSKREPFTALTIAALLIMGGAGLDTGVASLVHQHKEFTALSMAVDEDLARLEQSISALESSLRSLSEVVLQNRRGLDLVFLRQGGVCAALKEECCLYADHTGIVRDTMAKLRERLEKRKREREAEQNWFTSWFTSSPWLTPVISTLLGPVTTILIALIFGPCILNKLIERQQLL
ncbi:MLV-related proviral Env polyprotein-like [Pezoporus occidentalis]|uniref:MLV-related proviral Env polyprotein-like n=1 Tax=Pezoporus occidentalis TaxID=407982 RepID=UPI002F90C434